MAWWSSRKQALVADATIISAPVRDTNDNTQGNPRRRLYRTPDEWQREAWDFLDSLGEYRQGITWKANMMSRVRLIAATRKTPDDDPEPITSGPAFEFMRELAQGIGGQAALMSGFAVYLDVPGECYLVGETKPNGSNDWYLRSIEEIMPSFGDGEGRYKVTEGHGRWRLLPADSLVVRIWRPHKRWHNVADSPSRACRTLMRELELINRHIQAQYLSRLASAGIIAFPEEVTFPVRPEFADAPDPFIAEWIEIAAEAIRTPGTAASVVPIPMRMPGEYIDKIKHIDFTLKLDDRLIEKRDSAMSRLAISLDMPPEALVGTGKVNHWSAWAIDEAGVKVHVSPTVEVACDGITNGYLIPRLEAAGEDTSDIIVWYDASELILRPDRSAAAGDAYDRGEINGSAFRRETGFDDSDQPTEDEFKLMAQKKMVLTQPVNAPIMLGQMYPDLKPPAPPPAPASAPRPPLEGDAPPIEDIRNNRNPPEKPVPSDGPKKGAPPTPNKPTSKAPAKKAATIDPEELLVAALTHQAGLRHAVRIDLHGDWELLHPKDCTDHLFSCPVTHAMWRPIVNARPGQSGVYECWLNQHGQPVVGQKITDGDVLGMIVSTHTDERVLLTKT